MRLRALEPAAILTRGYSILQKARESQVVSKKSQVTPGEQLEAKVSDGSFPVTVGGSTRKTNKKSQPERAGARLI